MIAPIKPIRQPTEQTTVSVVLPVFNEVAVIDELLQQVSHALKSVGCRYEIIFVNDGSTDGSTEKLEQIAVGQQDIRIIHFSRNFGHAAAVQAGLEHAAGDAVIVMDSDLQDSPKAIKDFVEKWQDGYDVVFAERTKRKESLWKRALFYSFYRLLNLISNIPIPSDAGNFGLMDRRVVQCVNGLGDSDRYFPGLRRWAGFRQTGVVVERGQRYDDNPRVSLKGLFKLAKSAIFSFSSFPLMMFYGIAAISGSAFFVCMVFVLYHRFVTGYAVPGLTLTVMVGSFFGALNALGISILGEYVIRIYDQVRNRPPYVVARQINCSQQTRPESVLDWVDRQIPNAEDGTRRHEPRVPQ